MSPATGESADLVRDTSLGRLTASIAELGAGIRSLELDGVDLVEPYGDDRIAPKAAGLVLFPWPNRVRAARWTHEGARQLLDVTEPSTGNASHGLLRNTGWRILRRSADSVTHAATVFPQHGWPFRLDTRVTHALVDDGLAVTHVTRNEGAVPAPVALGVHPYLTIDGVPASELTLTVRAGTRLVTDDARIPVGSEPVDGDDDLNAGRRLSELDIDTGYTDLARVDTPAGPGTAGHGLTAPDGRRVELWGDASIRWLQVFTPHDFPAEDGVRQAVAIEPMTAPADALNSGEGLAVLQPGEEWTVRWGIRYTPAP